MYFVKIDSVVREIWGKTDTVLFIFAAASAEFALSKAVDWLYHTGKLPADPLGRLFSTVNYAQQILFANERDAHFAIQKINTVHAAVETGRASKIPNWAYQDVLYMLVDYSIRSYELLERNLTLKEKAEVYDVFKRVGCGMNIKELPPDYEAWEDARKNSLTHNYHRSDFTIDLFLQYKKHLGDLRFWLLKQVQAMIVPEEISEQLQLKCSVFARCLFYGYKMSRKLRLEKHITNLFMPVKYKAQVKQMAY